MQERTRQKSVDGMLDAKTVLLAVCLVNKTYWCKDGVKFCIVILHKHMVSYCSCGEQSC